MNTNNIDGVTTDETDVDSIVPIAEILPRLMLMPTLTDADARGTSVYEIIVSKDKSDKENIIILKKGIKI